MIVRLMMAVYWTIGWCYRLAHRKWPKIPYVHKNITLNGTVIDTVTAVEDIWFNDTTCEIEFNRDGKPGDLKTLVLRPDLSPGPAIMRYDMRTL